MEYSPQSKQPKTWKELNSLTNYLSDCDPRELRLKEDTLFYNIFKELVSRDIILKIIKKQIGKRRIALVKNNFPYTRTLQYLPNVANYCLWSLDGSLSEEKIKNIVNTSFPNNKWCKSERKINYKSVPELWHCHIFIMNYRTPNLAILPS